MILEREYRIKEQGGKYFPQYKYWATLNKWIHFTKSIMDPNTKEQKYIKIKLSFNNLNKALEIISNDKERIKRIYG